MKFLFLGRGEGGGGMPKVFVKSVRLMTKEGGRGGVKNLEKVVTSFMNGPFSKIIERTTNFKLYTQRRKIKHTQNQKESPEKEYYFFTYIC